MKTALTRPIATLALTALLLALPATSAFAADGSGFLADYSQLKTVKDAQGVERLLWVKDGVNFQNYDKILVEPIGFYPQPQPSKEVSLGALNDIKNYLDKLIPSIFGDSGVPVTTQPGSGVMRLRMAITASSVDKGLQPYQLIPVALIYTAASRAAGTANYDAKLMVESELLDSATGEPLARIVRTAKKLEVKSGEQLTLKLAKPQLDAWAAALAEEVKLRRKPKP